MLFERIFLQEFLLLTGGLLCLAVCFSCLAPPRKRMKRGVNMFLVWYVASVLCYTVFCRKMGQLTQFQPIPFYNFFDDSTPVSSFLIEGALNMVLFVPIGVVTGLAGWKWGYIVGGALLLSLSIEALQWVLRCGCCEMNDVINNCLGACLGMCLVLYKCAKNNAHHHKI